MSSRHQIVLQPGFPRKQELGTARPATPTTLLNLKPVLPVPHLTLVPSRHRPRPPVLGLVAAVASQPGLPRRQERGTVKPATLPTLQNLRRALPVPHLNPVPRRHRPRPPVLGLVPAVASQPGLPRRQVHGTVRLATPTTLLNLKPALPVQHQSQVR